MKKIYFASPLFTNMEIQYNAKTVKRIRDKIFGVEVFLPQEQMAINDKSGYADSIMIATFDTDALLTCDLVVAVLDGAVIDPGVASEIGVAFQAGIPVIGLYTDVRQQGYDNDKKLMALSEIAESQFPYVNLYTVGLIKKNGIVVSDETVMLDAISDILELVNFE